MRLVPLAERSGVDLYNGGFGKGVGAHKFVVRGMEGYRDDADFAGYAFGAPGEITGFEAEATVFGVAAAGADEMDAFGADPGVGWLAAFLECSVDVRSGQGWGGGWGGGCRSTSSCGSRHALRR